jgi:hypothetical protein
MKQSWNPPVNISTTAPTGTNAVSLRNDQHVYMTYTEKIEAELCRIRASHDRLLAAAEHAYRILQAIRLRGVWDGSEIQCLAFLDSAITDAKEQAP